MRIKNPRIDRAGIHYFDEECRDPVAGEGEKTVLHRTGVGQFDAWRMSVNFVVEEISLEVWRPGDYMVLMQEDDEDQWCWEVLTSSSIRKDPQDPEEFSKKWFVI